MCGRWYAERAPAGHEPWEEAAGPRIRVAAALGVLVPVVLSGLFLVAFVPSLWWIFTTYGWVVLPASGTLARGLAELPSSRVRSATAEEREHELLEALMRRDEVSAVAVASETSLTVAEADRMLGELAEGGHLEVRVRGGGLSYALWGTPAVSGNRDLEAGVQGET